MTVNKITSNIVKLFFQVNNQFQECNPESQVDFFETIGGEAEIFAIDFLDNKIFTGQTCKALVNQSILVILTDELTSANSSNSVLTRYFKDYGVEMVLVLKFGKHAQVKRKSIR